VDVLLEALPQILGGGSRAQVVVLGTGKKALEQQVARMESQFPSSAKGVVEFNGARRPRCGPFEHPQRP
jgi:granule-bound starch synthase